VFRDVRRRYPRGRLGRHGWCFYLGDALGTSVLARGGRGDRV